MTDGRIKIRNGKILITSSGKIATGDACCCGCTDCPSILDVTATWVYTGRIDPPDPPCQFCPGAMNGEITLTAWGGGAGVQPNADAPDPAYMPCTIQISCVAGAWMAKVQLWQNNIGDYCGGSAGGWYADVSAYLACVGGKPTGSFTASMTDSGSTERCGTITVTLS